MFIDTTPEVTISPSSSTENLVEPLFWTSINLSFDVGEGTFTINFPNEPVPLLADICPLSDIVIWLEVNSLTNDWLTYEVLKYLVEEPKS